MPSTVPQENPNQETERFTSHLLQTTYVEVCSNATAVRAAGRQAQDHLPVEKKWQKAQHDFNKQTGVALMRLGAHAQGGLSYHRTLMGGRAKTKGGGGKGS